MDVKQKILKAADALFKRVGIRSVSMDDIAKDLGMSKKTIYKFFSNKAEIVHAVTIEYFSQDSVRSEAMHQAASDPIQEIILFMKHMTVVFRDISPVMIYDLQKYYPRSWALFKDYKYDVMLRMIRGNLEKGVEQGLYRSNLKIDILAKFRVEQIDMIFDPEIFSPQKYNLPEVQLELLDHFIHGLVTDSGKKLLYQYLESEHDKN